MGKSMKKRKKITTIVTIIFILSALAGCGSRTEETGTQTAAGRQEKAGGQKKIPMGRYVEKTVELPELAETENVLGMLDIEQDIVIYTYLGTPGESAGRYYTYRMGQAGAWEREEAAWLDEAAGGGQNDVRAIRKGGDNLVYAWYFDKDYIAHIIRTADGENAEEANIPALKNKENVSNGFAVSGKGEVLVSFMGGSMKGCVVMFDTDGNELRRFKTNDLSTDNICDFMDAAGNRLVAVREDGKGFTAYDTDSGKLLEEIEVDTQMQGPGGKLVDGSIRVGGNDDYYYLSSRGLGHFQSGGSIMETIIDGSLNKIGLEGIGRVAFLIGEEQDFTVLYRDDVYELARYVYDENMPTVPEKQLTIYGLSKNKSVSRAVGTFQQENPDVRIIYITAQSEEGASTTADSIRTLNTELLAGKGADILMLDGLSVETYIEKGVLADISDVVGPMIDSGELLGNMTAGYEREDGSIYGIPVRFGIPLLMGDKEAGQAFGSLRALREYMKKHPENKFFRYGFRTLAYGELADFILLTNYQEIIGDGEHIDRDKLLEFIETVRAAGDVLGATAEMEALPPNTQEEIDSWQKGMREYFGEGPRYEIGYLPVKEGMLKAAEIKGVWDMMEPLGMQEQYGAALMSANGQYIPTGIIGVNSATEEIEKAKDFVRCILSEQEQEKDLGDGMPVNIRALESYCSKDTVNSNISAGSFFILDGEEIETGFYWPSKEGIAQFTDMAETLETPLNIDRVLREMILSEIKPYFEGSVTAQQAVDAVLTKVNTYLSE